MTLVRRDAEVSEGYYKFEQLVKDRVRLVLASGDPVFQTDAPALFDIYLSELRTTRRQHYNCHACRRFFERYGSLVTVNEEGRLESVLWNITPPKFFRDAVERLRDTVEAAHITGLFLWSEDVWGVEQTGAWTHLAAPVQARTFNNLLLTVDQQMAATTEEFKKLTRVLGELSIPDIEQAVRVLESDALYRGEKTLGNAQWLLKLAKSLRGMRGARRSNLVWVAAAEAPAGFCHVRSGMLQTLLDDILQGLPFAEISRRWAEKMNPSKYQRPTVVKEGTINQAEQVVEKLRSSGALARRFARLEDVLHWVWQPGRVRPKRSPQGSVFGHLKPTPPSFLELPGQYISYEKFLAEVLPEALNIEYLTTVNPTSFIGLVTAENPDAPPLMQWDSLDARNPLSWYFYKDGSRAHEWNLTPGTWVKVAGICPSPAHWKFHTAWNVPEMAIFILEGARDMRHRAGGGFFPECLRNEYHGVRSVMEGFANSAVISGRDSGTANGIALTKTPGRPGWRHTFRVTSPAGQQTYIIDHWG